MYKNVVVTVKQYCEISVVWLANLKSQIGDLLLSPLLCGGHVVLLAMWLVRRLL